MKAIKGRSILKSVKPQVKARHNVKALAVKAMTDWFLEEFEVHGNQGHVLAEAVVEAEIKRFANACKNAADVFLNDSDTLALLVADSMKLAEQMDACDELEEILAAQQNREDSAKY